MIEEAEDQSGVEIDQRQCSRRLADPGLSEAEQQSERVAVGAHRVRAGVELAVEAIGEERLEDRRERAH